MMANDDMVPTDRSDALRGYHDDDLDAVSDSSLLSARPVTESPPNHAPVNDSRARINWARLHVVNATVATANPATAARANIEDFTVAPVGQNLALSSPAENIPPPNSTADGPEHELPLPATGEMANNISRAFLKNEFSDFTIIGIGCELKVHRFIIAARSEYMAKACRLGHCERKDRKMHLTTDDPEILKQMVAFMYGINPTDRQVPCSSQGPELLLVRYANLYEIGSRFGVHGLPKFALDQLNRLLNIRTDLKWSSTALLRLVDYIYEGAQLQNGTEVRRILVKFFRKRKNTERLMEKDQGVRNELAKRGEFMADVYCMHIPLDHTSQQHSHAVGQGLPTGGRYDAWF